MTPMTADTGKPETQPEPCQCMTSWAYITNSHRGHCCFFPASQACHAAEVAEWERQRDLRRGRITTTPEDQGGK